MYAYFFSRFSGCSVFSNFVISLLMRYLKNMGHTTLRAQVYVKNLRPLLTNVTTKLLVCPWRPFQSSLMFVDLPTQELST
jgi:hypothetical protein